MNLRHGSKVWLEDRDSAWLAAEVLDSDGNRFLLVTDSGRKVVSELIVVVKFKFELNCDC